MSSEVHEIILSETIENLLVAARGVHEEQKTRETALVVTKLEEAQMWAERWEKNEPTAA